MSQKFFMISDLFRLRARFPQRVTRAFLATFAALSCGIGPAYASDPLIVADQRGVLRALLQAAHVDQDIGFDLHWVEFDAAAPLLQAMGAGAVDIGIAGDGPYLFAWAAGIPARAVLLLPPRGGGHMTAIVVPKDSPIHNLKDLAGKKIATGRGSIGHLLALSLLQDGTALRPAYVFLPPSQAKTALDSGAVEAWATWEPYITLAAAQTGARVVADGQGVMPNNGLMVASNAAIAGKKAQIQALLKRITQAYGWSSSHPDEFAALLSRQTGLPVGVATKVAREQITIPAAITPATIAEEAHVIDTYKQAHLIDVKAPLAQAFDTGFTP